MPGLFRHPVNGLHLIHWEGKDSHARVMGIGEHNTQHWTGGITCSLLATETHSPGGDTTCHAGPPREALSGADDSQVLCATDPVEEEGGVSLVLQGWRLTYLNNFSGWQGTETRYPGISRAVPGPRHREGCLWWGSFPRELSGEGGLRSTGKGGPHPPLPQPLSLLSSPPEAGGHLTGALRCSLSLHLLDHSVRRGAFEAPLVFLGGQGTPNIWL